MKNRGIAYAVPLLCCFLPTSAKSDTMTMNFLRYESIIEMVYEIADCLIVPVPFNQGNAHLRGVHCCKKNHNKGK